MERFVEWCGLVFGGKCSSEKHLKIAKSVYREMCCEQDTYLVNSLRRGSCLTRFTIMIYKRNSIPLLYLLRLILGKEQMPRLRYTVFFYYTKEFEMLTQSEVFQVDTDLERVIRCIEFAQNHSPYIISDLDRFSSDCKTEATLICEKVFLLQEFPRDMLDKLFSTGLCRPVDLFCQEVYYIAVSTLDLTRVKYLAEKEIEPPPDILSHLFTDKVFEQIKNFEETNCIDSEEESEYSPLHQSFQLLDYLIHERSELEAKAEREGSDGIIERAVKHRYFDIVPKLRRRGLSISRSSFFRELFRVLRKMKQEGLENPIDVEDEEWINLLGGKRSVRYLVVTRYCCVVTRGEADLSNDTVTRGEAELANSLVTR